MIMQKNVTLLVHRHFISIINYMSCELCLLHYFWSAASTLFNKKKEKKNLKKKETKLVLY